MGSPDELSSRPQQGAPEATSWACLQFLSLHLLSVSRWKTTIFPLFVKKLNLCAHIVFKEYLKVKSTIVVWTVVYYVDSEVDKYVLCNVKPPGQGTNCVMMRRICDHLK